MRVQQQHQELPVQGQGHSPVPVTVRAKTVRAHCRAKFTLLRSCLVFLCYLISLNMSAQENLPINFGEELLFNIHFKYGIVMKAGTAEYRNQKATYRQQPAVKTQLTFRTTSTFDKIFKIRDTLVTHLNLKLIPIHHKKFLHEGKTEYVEDIYYQQFGANYTQVRSMRTKEGVVRFDTIMSANSEGHDLLNSFLIVRQIDYSNLQIGQTFEYVSFIGRDAVRMKLRYTGQAIIEKSASEKYKTHKFSIDIIDKVFTESKNAVEIWVSDDLNHIPIKIKAKLKIGAAEIELSSAKNLKHPFDAKIEIHR